MLEASTARADESDLRLGAWLGLGAFLLVVLAGRAQDLLPSPERMVLILAWPVAAWLFERTRSASVPLAYLVGGGLLLRLAHFGAGGSDHLAATNEAIGVFLAGGDPYRHIYQSTIPPGSPVSQPPVELWLHLPGALLGGLSGVMATETVAALAVLLLLAWLADRVSWTLGLPALGLYAALGNLVNLTNDGSNDTSTGALVLLAALALVWALRRVRDGGDDPRAIELAGVAGALAVGTKQTTVFIVLLLAAGLWHLRGQRAALRYLGAAVVALAILSAPFIILGPFDFVHGIASFAGAHADIYGWNIWVFAQQLGWPVLDPGPATIVDVVVTLVAFGIALAWPPRSVARAAAAGVLVTLVLLLAARWTTYAYFAGLAPLILALPALDAWESEGLADRPWDPKGAAVEAQEAGAG